MKNTVIMCINLRDNQTLYSKKNKTLKQKKKIKDIIVENLLKLQCAHTIVALHAAENFTENMPTT